MRVRFYDLINSLQRELGWTRYDVERFFERYPAVVVNVGNLSLANAVDAIFVFAASLDEKM